MIISGLNEKMDKLDTIRSRANLGAILIGSGIIVFFPSMAILRSDGLCIFAVFLMVSGYLFLIGIKRRYKRLYKEVFVEDTLNANFENVLYVWNGGFSKQQIMNLSMFANGTMYKSEDYLRARYHGTDFEMADVYISCNGNNSSTLFKGRIIIFDFPDKIIRPTRIYSESFSYKTQEAMLHSEKVEMESAKFNKAFQVFSKSPHDTFYLLTPQFMERLMVLKEKYENIAICFDYNRVVFAFNERTNDAFDRTMLDNKSISYPREIEKVQKEVDDIKYIIDMINQIGG